MIDDILSALTDTNDKKAYENTKKIAALSEFTPEYYQYLPEFASLLSDRKSYVRTRAFILCCSQARWDTEGKIEQILPDMMRLLHDEKPTVVRQCLSSVIEIVVFRPELSLQIKKEVESIDLNGYKDSVVPLIKKDCDRVMEILHEQILQNSVASETVPQISNSLTEV